MLTIENLSFYKNEKKIFSALGFSLFLGTNFIIVGKNGSGKTTLLKILAGIYKKSNGNILWNLENIENFRHDFNGDLQFIGHKNFLKQELSVLENIEFYAKLRGEKILIPAALRFFKLENIANEKIKNLSAGWQKRSQLALLIACPATIWILDEPTNHLDAEGKKLLQELIKIKLENQGLAIIATHDRDLIANNNKICMEDFIE